jgi:RND family efflux transporter MFP subunit
MGRRSVAAAVFLFSAVAALAGGGCARHEAPGEEGAHGARAVNGATAAVTTVRVRAAEQQALAILPARVEAREEVTIAAKRAARLTRFLFADGESFRRGDVLAVFAAPEAQMAVGAARAAVAAAERQRDVARLQETRIDSLFAIRVATRRELEIAEAARREAEAALAQAEADLASLVADTDVRAPFDGAVVRRRVDAGASVLPGTPLLDIRSAEIGAIAAPVPESIIGARANAHLGYQIGDGPWRDARLLRLEGMIDASTRTRMARLAPIDSSVALVAGAFARVRVGVREDALSGTSARDESAGAANIATRPIASVPAESVVRRGALRGAFLVRDGRALLRWIRTGRETGGVTEVLAGLAPGDEIVLSPAGLFDGQPVNATAAPENAP